MQSLVDAYGFRLEVSDEEARQLQACEASGRETEKAWHEKEQSLGSSWWEQAQEHENDHFSMKALVNAAALKKLVRRGIPMQHRPKVWWSTSGAGKKQAVGGLTYYKELLSMVEGKETEHTRQIDADLHRTFPGHPWLHSAAALAMLRRVLVAYSWRNPSVGYCQSMNYVTAYLLLVMRSEEHAFWLLATLLEDLLYDDSYSTDLAGCHVEIRVLKDLLDKKLPRVSTHLDKLGVELTLLCTEWFLCLFAKSLPTETTMRVWDSLFHEGAKVLFRVALALFKLSEDQILEAAHVGQVIEAMQATTRHAYDRDQLTKVAFEKLGSFPMKSILKQRRRRQPAVTAELQERVRRHNSK